MQEAAEWGRSGGSGERNFNPSCLQLSPAMHCKQNGGVDDADEESVGISCMQYHMFYGDMAA